MKNTQGENYEFVEVTPNHWQLQGQPLLNSVIKGGQLVTEDTTNCQVANYSGQLSISPGNTIYGRRITQINYVGGEPEYVTL
jgi:hypothetical protein